MLLDCAAAGEFVLMEFPGNCSTHRRRKMARGSWPRLTSYEATLACTSIPTTILTPLICSPVSSIPVKMGELQKQYRIYDIQNISRQEARFNVQSLNIAGSYRSPSSRHSKGCSAYPMPCIKQPSSCSILMEMEWLRLVRRHSSYCTRQVIFS